MNSTLDVPDFHLSKELFDPVFILEEALCMSDLDDHFVLITCTTGALHQNYTLANEKLVQEKVCTILPSIFPKKHQTPVFDPIRIKRLAPIPVPFISAKHSHSIKIINYRTPADPYHKYNIDKILSDY